MILSRQAYFCLDKRCVLSRQTHACHNKHVFVATKMILVAASANDRLQPGAIMSKQVKAQSAVKSLAKPEESYCVQCE